MKEKLDSLEKKVLLGGENLLEKAEAQEKLLETSAKELEQRRKEEAELKQALQEKEVTFLRLTSDSLFYIKIPNARGFKFVSG